jgi:hypothetical protein
MREPENDIPKTGAERYKQMAASDKKMKTALSLGRIALLLGTLVFLAAASASAFGSPTPAPESALTAAHAWLTQIDAGNYEDSYGVGCRALHNKVDAQKWGTILTTFRTPLGAVLDRKITESSYNPNGFEGLEGECAIITYTTSFKGLESAKEVIVLKLEDGKWRGAGYNVGPGETDSTPPQPTPAVEQTTQESTQTLPK